MYEIVDTADLVVPQTPSDFLQFLDSCAKKGIKMVILHDIDSSSQKAQSNHDNGEDVATEHLVKISAKVYSTKNKNLKTEIKINEKSSTIREQSVADEMQSQQQLLQSGAKKLVLQLLKNDIY